VRRDVDVQTDDTAGLERQLRAQRSRVERHQSTAGRLWRTRCRRRHSSAAATARREQARETCCGVFAHGHFARRGQLAPDARRFGRGEWSAFLLCSSCCCRCSRITRLCVARNFFQFRLLHVVGRLALRAHGVILRLDEKFDVGHGHRSNVVQRETGTALLAQQQRRLHVAAHAVADAQARQRRNDLQCAHGDGREERRCGRGVRTVG